MTHGLVEADVHQGVAAVSALLEDREGRDRHVQHQVHPNHRDPSWEVVERPHQPRGDLATDLGDVGQLRVRDVHRRRHPGDELRVVRVGSRRAEVVGERHDDSFDETSDVLSAALLVQLGQEGRATAIDLAHPAPEDLEHETVAPAEVVLHGRIVLLTGRGGNVTHRHAVDATFREHPLGDLDHRALRASGIRHAESVVSRRFKGQGAAGTLPRRSGDVEPAPSKPRRVRASKWAPPQ
ncbi:hypothetical protein REQ_06660 [Prescottella equi 103S]|uniref:Uncharacterized protein n=1 Tax=Rhodococcus hoagii (strain 103S) TaxID=685727 RepID=A0A3S5Y2M6_RHOH1|nr:hypothetical protein REQ_06660 [Prescottella equi 103S]